MMIVVGGCRNYHNEEVINIELDAFLRPYRLCSEIIFLSGHCSGVDMLAEQYAITHGFRVKRYPADWKRYGRAAGPIRNEQMVKSADGVIAFWDGKSRGTKNLIELANKHNKKLHIVYI